MVIKFLAILYLLVSPYNSIAQHLASELNYVGNSLVFYILKPNINPNELMFETEYHQLNCSPDIIYQLVRANKGIGVAYKSAKISKGFERIGSVRCTKKNKPVNIIVLGGLLDHYHKYYQKYGGRGDFQTYSKRATLHEMYHAWQDQNSSYESYIKSNPTNIAHTNENIAEMAAIFQLSVQLKDINLDILQDQLNVRRQQSESKKFQSKYEKIYLFLGSLKSFILSNGGINNFLQLNSLSKIDQMNIYGVLSLEIYQNHFK